MIWVWLVLGVAALPVLLLCLPVRVVVAARHGDGEGLGVDGDIGPLAGALGVRVWHGQGQTAVAPTVLGWDVHRFPFGGGKEKPGKPARERRKAKKPAAESPDLGWRTRLRRHRALWSRYRSVAGRMRKPAFRLLRRLVGGVSFGRLEGRVTFGLTDPSDTGQAYGLACVLIPLLGRRVSLSVQPEFSGPVFSGRVRVRVLIWPLVIIRAALVFGLRLGFVWLVESRNYKRTLRRLEDAGPAAPAAV